VLIWSNVEVGLGIVACSLATLRPLLQTVLVRFGLASADSSMGPYKQYHRSASRNVIPLSSKRRSTRLSVHDENGIVPSRDRPTMNRISSDPGQPITWNDNNRYNHSDKPLPQRPDPVRFDSDSQVGRSSMPQEIRKSLPWETRYDPSSSEEEIWNNEPREPPKRLS
jgi:hypothetical protein